MRAWAMVMLVTGSLLGCEPSLRFDADDADAGGPDAAVDAPTGHWERCCFVFPGVMTRSTGIGMECFCEAGRTCDFEPTCWVRDAGPAGDGGLGGVTDAGPIEDAALDALSPDAADGSP